MPSILMPSILMPSIPMPGLPGLHIDIIHYREVLVDMLPYFILCTGFALIMSL